MSNIDWFAAGFSCAAVMFYGVYRLLEHYFN